MMDLAEDEGIPEGYSCPCLQYVSAGEPAVDCCSVDCTGPSSGMLTVHIETVFPSDNFPVASSGFEPCKAQTWVASLVVTSARCARSTNDQGELVSTDELQAAALLMAIDQYAIVTSLSCCVVNEGVGSKRKRRVQIQESRPQVSEGGCASIQVRAFVEAGTICACEPAVS
jgi:hypothetical protein